MRVIILNQFFYPDISATSQLMTDLAESFTERGIEVTALSGRGLYNGGRPLTAREDFNGIKIERAWATSFGKRSMPGRLSDYLSFYIGASLKLLRLPRHDVIMALTTPPLIGAVALAVGRIRRMSVVALVQDVYPDIAVALGALPARNPLTRTLDRVSRAVLKGSDRVIVLSECMRSRILAKIGSRYASKIDVIHNWADGEKIFPVEDAENPFLKRHDLEGRFVVLFSGNLGRVNEFSTVLEAARRLGDRADILFLFIGEGAASREIKEYVERNHLRNIRTLPYQSRSDLRYSLAAGSASLVTLAEGLAGLSVPSKTYGILAAGRPILFVGDKRSDVARIVAENACGEVFEPGDSERLAETIKRWSEDREELRRLGRSARALFDSRFDRSRAVSSYIDSFEKCMPQENCS
jgi:glycosyltransferase involved in cell wall biosynthesis